MYPFVRHFLTERYWNWISWYLDVSPSCCRQLQFLGFLTGAPTTNFARKRVKTRYLTLFRATRNCVVICGASLLYEMVTHFVVHSLYLWNFRTSFALTCQGSFSKRAVSNLVHQYQLTRFHRTEEVSNNFSVSWHVNLKLFWYVQNQFSFSPLKTQTFWEEFSLSLQVYFERTP